MQYDRPSADPATPTHYFALPGLPPRGMGLKRAADHSEGVSPSAMIPRPSRASTTNTPSAIKECRLRQTYSHKIEPTVNEDPGCEEAMRDSPRGLAHRCAVATPAEALKGRIVPLAYGPGTYETTPRYIAGLLSWPHMIEHITRTGIMDCLSADLQLPFLGSLFHTLVRIDGDLHAAVLALAIRCCVVSNGLCFSIAHCA